METTLVPLHWIPNVAFGKLGDRSVIRIMFPHLINSEHLVRFQEKDLDIIYDRAFFPTAAEVFPASIAEWPPTRAIALIRARDPAGRIALSSVIVPAAKADDFMSGVRRRIRDDCDMGRTLILHQVRGVKLATKHDPRDPLARQRAWHDIARHYHRSRLDVDCWYIDVGVEWHIEGHCVFFDRHFHTSAIQWALKQDAEAAQKFISRGHFQVDLSSSTTDLAGYRSDVPMNIPGANDLPVYVQAYTTDKVMLISQRKGQAKSVMITGRQIFAKSNEKGEVQRMADITQAFQDAMNTIHSNARIEHRVKLDRKYLEFTDFDFGGGTIEEIILIAVPSPQMW